MPVRLSELPPIDLVLFLRHDHDDHLDYPTIRQLAKGEVPFVTSLGVGAHLEAWGVAHERITELDWWESHRVVARDGKAELTVTAAPSQHFSGRGLRDRNATLWSSLVLRSRRHAVFFSGDTGLTSEYATIRERLGPFDLVMLEVGAFHRRGATSTSARRTRSRPTRCSAAAPSCRCIGAPSASRCTPGTSRRRR